ncbi:MAG: hydantoinase/oxoprolinase family protein [Promethearchaeota archaeon]|nr:MAG: hydantoinase/oxoprolinase family protein [Candidatus Lokiarchaeota archaeon]
MFRIGVDTGGTFTDCVVINSESGSLKRYKTPSTPQDYSKGVLNVFSLAAKDHNLELRAFLKNTELIIHGTTIATNLILSKEGKNVGLIATKGFRDIIEQWWKEERRYDMKWPPPIPPCPRRLRREVDERVDFTGKVLKELNEGDVNQALEFFKNSNIDSIAISLIFSPINPDHEKKIAQIFRTNYPEATIHLSSEILPQLREYERTMATILNAYVAPYSSKYLTDLCNQLKNEGFEKDLLIMQSNSGVASVNTISKIPIRLALSGPSSGPLAGLFFSELLGESNIITIDMGGTSFDVCLIKEKVIPTATDGYIGRFRLALPTVDIHSLGAGGGSIAWVDKGGILRVGPKSAGALPGPACYGQGGFEPTVTDANLLLGYINPDNFLGGRMKLEKDLAKNAIMKNVANKLNTNLKDAASGIIKVVNNNMIDGINAVSVKRGYNPKDFVLVAAGGAGPVHASELAKIAGISKIIIPRTASAFCAFGMVISNIRHDYVRPFIYPIKKAEFNLINNLYKEMELEAHSTLKAEGVEDKDIEFKWSMDMRYIGQIYEVETSIPCESLSETNVYKIEDLFNKKHEMIYGYSDKDSDIEVVHLRVKGIGRQEKPKLEMEKEISENPPNEALKEVRKVFFENLEDYEDTNIFNGSMLLPGNLIKGPAIIEEPDTTIVIIPNSNCRIDKFNNYIIKMANDNKKGGLR